jgi:hypothetical protein
MERLNHDAVRVSKEMEQQIGQLFQATVRLAKEMGQTNGTSCDNLLRQLSHHAMRVSKELRQQNRTQKPHSKNVTRGDVQTISAH